MNRLSIANTMKVPIEVFCDEIVRNFDFYEYGDILSESLLFVGYDTEAKGYRCYNEKTQKLAEMEKMSTLNRLKAQKNFRILENLIVTNSLHMIIHKMQHMLSEKIINTTIETKKSMRAKTSWMRRRRRKRKANNHIKIQMES